MICFEKEVFTQSHETPAKKWEAIPKESFSTQPFWFMIKFEVSLSITFSSPDCLRRTNRVFPAPRFNFDKKSGTETGGSEIPWRCYVRICMSYELWPGQWGHEAGRPADTLSPDNWFSNTGLISSSTALNRSGRALCKIGRLWRSSILGLVSSQLTLD